MGASSNLQIPRALDFHQIKPDKHIFIGSNKTFHSDSSNDPKQSIYVYLKVWEVGGKYSQLSGNKFF